MVSILQIKFFSNELNNMLGLCLVSEIIVHSHYSTYLTSLIQLNITIRMFMKEKVLQIMMRWYTKKKKQFENFRLSLTILGMTSSILVQKAQTNLLKHYFPFAFSFYETEYVQIKDAIIAIKKSFKIRYRILASTHAHVNRWMY